MALEQHISFAKEHEIRVEQSFSELLIQLVSARPSVCAEAMDAYSNLRSLSLRVLHADFVRHARVEDGPRDKRGSPIVYMRVYESSLHKGEVFLPLSLLQSLSVVLSIWKDEHAEGSHETALLVQELADALLSPDNNDQSADDRGLASAKLLEDGTAFSVESVSRCI